MCRCSAFARILPAVVMAVASCLCCAAQADGLAVGFRQLHIGSSEGLPSEKVQQVFQDSDGYIWCGTENGVARYDGSKTVVFKSDIRRGNVLTNNNIKAIAEDHSRRIWIGTTAGLNVYDKAVGRMTRIDHRLFKGNPVSCILPTRDGNVLVGTDQGLFRYLPDSDSLYVVTRELSGDVMPQTSVKALLEDSRGNVWIGTWNEGLYRLDSSGRFYRYPQINDRKSAHVLFEDSRHRIWVGSWGRGLHMLRNPYEPEKTTYVNYSHVDGDANTLGDNIIYSISEDPTSRTLWVGTRKGISLLAEDSDRFANISDDGSGTIVNEVTSIICDRMGVMWVSLLGQGVMALATNSTGLALDRLDVLSARYGVNSVDRMTRDSAGRMWISLGSNMGLAVLGTDGKTVESYNSYPFSAAYPTPYTVKSLCEDRSGRMLVGTYDGGLYIVDRKHNTVEHHTKNDSPWLAGDRVSEIYRDKTGRTWFGGLPGLTVVNKDGSYCRFDSMMPADINVRSIVQGADGCIWVGTSDLGVLRIDGSGTSLPSYSVKWYYPGNGTLNSTEVVELHCDATDRLWVGTDGSGLSLYDYSGDTFVPVHIKWNLPGDIVSSMLDGNHGDLWVGSNMGLYSIKVAADTTLVNFRLYTSADGAQDNIFSRHSAFKDENGTLYFGGPHGMNIVTGDGSNAYDYALPVTITDIKVGGLSWAAMPEDVRYSVSSLAPEYTEKVTLAHDQNNLGIEFGVLDFANHALQHKYAYKLEGVDDQWQYPESSRRFAYYNNIPPGNYTFRVKASDAKGEWLDDERVVRISINPPWWAGIWAKTIYSIVFFALVFVVFTVSRRRVRRRNELHLRELELAQAEQLNREKLRFFTNVTHEWLTPLSIISAVAEEMKDEDPSRQEYHKIMMSSVGRLSRLLQQTLEFRKAESGNLRLRVSRRDVVKLTSVAVENIMPVMKVKGLTCTFSCEEETLMGWVDPDKLDKILYNLLSNASKYVLSGGMVQVSLVFDRERCMAVIRVRDNGPGIPASRLPDLFRRFYDGEHRRYSTMGNGIGLSLTKDLVELHHGKIDVESTEGVGTEFCVELPLARESYTEAEIDSMSAADVDNLDDAADGPREFDSDEKPERASLLIVEDDRDLLTLMDKILQSDYDVFMATSAERADEVLEKHDISLIITDMMMPGMNGIEYCRNLKSRIETSHIPVLLLTANTIEETEVEAYSAGVDGFMHKPFSIAVLQARIVNLLKMRRMSNQVFRGQFESDVAGLDFSTIDGNFIRRSVECVTAHIADADFNQAVFAKEMGMARSTLFRKLKSLTGLSYTAFVRNIRLKTACTIMEEKQGIRISELAYAVGFNDPKYFSQCFKKEFGMLPSEFAERFVTEKKENL